MKYLKTKYIIAFSFVGLLLSSIAAVAIIAFTGGILYEAKNVKDSKTINSINFDKIQIESTFSDIFIEINHEDDIQIEYSATVNGLRQTEYKIETRELNGKLTIEVDAKIQDFFQFNFADYKNKGVLVVSIPEDYSNDIYARSVSGSISSDMDRLELNEINVETVSGDIAISKVEANRSTIESVSGKLIYVNNDILNTNVISVSGDVEIEYDYKVEDFEFAIETVSGDVNFDLPQATAFNYSFESVSGDLINDFEDIMKVSRKGSIQRGEKGITTDDINVNTVSGDLRLKY